MTENIIYLSGIYYEINKNNFTASIIRFPNARGDVFIPSLINYQSHDYKIISIKEGSFKNNQIIRSIRCPEDSYLRIIEKNSFSMSSIKSLTIPPSLEELEYYWCKKAARLKSIIISPANKSFKYLDEDQTIIIGKSDINQEDFDTIYYVKSEAKQLTIPNFIKYLKPLSFYKCNKLNSIEISEDSQLHSICKNAFSGTSLTSFTIPKNVEKLEDGWCKCLLHLTKVQISPANKHFAYLDKEKQIVIGKSDNNNDIFDTIVFADRDIKYVTIPKFIKYIKADAFAYCKSLKTVDISEDSELISIGKRSFYFTSIQRFFIPASVEIIGNCWPFTKLLKTVTISPENKHFTYLDEKRQIVIGKSDTSKDIFDTIVFADRDIKYAMIPKFIKYISSNAFENCKTLKTVEFQKDSELTIIGKSAFYMSSIIEITIPKSVCQIKSNAFCYCRKLEKFILEEGSKLQSFEKLLLFSCENITEIKIPENSSLRCINRSSFSFTKIETFTIPPKLEEIDNSFDRIALPIKNIFISPKNKNFKYLDEEHKIILGKNDINSDVFDNIVFASSDVSYVVIPKSIKFISKSLFTGCKKLVKFDFEENSELYSIQGNAFYDSSIQNISIPASVEKLENDWCHKAGQLKTVTISPESKNFKYLDKEHQIIVGKSDKDKDVFDEIVFVNRDIKDLTIPKYIKTIKTCAFENCYKLNTICFSEDSELVKIGQRAFNYSSITTITIPKNVSKIKKFAFNYCKKLKKVKIEEGSKLKLLKKNLFYSCDNLSDIVIPDNCSLRTINDSVFSFTSIKSVFIPSNVENLKDGWCCFMSKLKTVTISPANKHFKYLNEENQIIISKSGTSKDIFDTIEFANKNIEDIAIPYFIKYIKSYGFKNCERLKTVDISEDSELCSFSKELFSNTSIESIFIPPKVETLDNLWCFRTPKLIKVIISPKNKSFKYLDDEHQVIIGKSDTDGNIFDTIFFANRNIKRVTIPNFIKCIKPCAFEKCSQLKRVDISDDSEIEIIGQYAFSSTSIVSFKVPRKVPSNSSNFLGSCSKMRQFEFLGDDFVDDRIDGLSQIFENLILASFPNSRRIVFKKKTYMYSFKKELMIFVNAGVKIKV